MLPLLVLDPNFLTLDDLDQWLPGGFGIIRRERVDALREHLAQALTPKADTTGWYLWAGGEMSSDPDFFVPLHVAHLDEWRPGLLRYLGLAPGWRFLIDPQAGVEDVWQDRSLLEVD